MNIGKSILVSGFAAILVTVGIGAYHFMAPSWTIDAQKARIQFDLPDGGASGTVEGLTADVHFDPLQPAQSSITASVDVKSLTTKLDMRDKHLMSNDYFNAEKYPKITFTATGIEPSEKGFVANGKLQMRDSVHTISIPFTFEEKGDTAWFKGNFELFSGDYGVGKKSKSGKDRVVVKLEVPAVKSK